jgi:hypothetical protein
VPSTVSVVSFSPAAPAPVEIPVPLFALESQNTSPISSVNLNANSPATGSSLVAQETQESESTTFATRSGGGGTSEEAEADRADSLREEPLKHLPSSDPVLIVPLSSTVSPSKPEDIGPSEDSPEEKPEKPEDEGDPSETSTSLLDSLAPEVLAQGGEEDEKLDSLDQFFSSGAEEPAPDTSWPYLLEAGTVTALVGGLLTRTRHKKRHARGQRWPREDS